MKLSLPPEIQKLIEDRVKSGKYETAEDVVAAAVSSLEQQEAFGDFAPGEIDQLVHENGSRYNNTGREVQRRRDGGTSRRDNPHRCGIVRILLATKQCCAGR